MAYTAKHDIQLDQIAYLPGDPVRFSADDLAEYEDTRTGPVAELLACGAIEGEPIRPGAAPSLQSDEQLVAIAQAMGIGVPVPFARDGLLAAIADARARLAGLSTASATTGATGSVSDNGSAASLPPVPGKVPTAEGTVLTPSAPPEAIAVSAELGAARLSEIATAEGADFAADADAATLVAAIERARALSSAPDRPRIYPGLGAARLGEIALAEGVIVADGATATELVRAIDAKRGGPAA